MYSSTRQTEVYCAVIQQLTIIALLQKWRLSMMQTKEKCMVFRWRFTHVTITYIPKEQKFMSNPRGASLPHYEPTNKEL
nr:MAG TPA: hypothetical protein [Caudoviricetes sp.]